MHRGASIAAQSLRALWLVSISLALPQLAHAYTLIPLTSFSTLPSVVSGPEGLAYGLENTDLDPELERVLYVTEGDSCSGNCTVFVYDAGATGTPSPLRSFDIATLSETRGADAMPNGNLLVSSIAQRTIREVIGSGASAGQQAVGGVNYVFPVIGAEIEAVVYLSATSVYFGDENTSTLYHLNPTTNTLIGSPLAVGLDDFSGLAAAENGVLFLTSEAGEGFVRILDPNAGILEALTIDLRGPTLNQPGCEDENGPGDGVQPCIDAEGAAYDPVNRVLFIAFENENRVLSFQVVGAVPEPNSVVLLGAALAGIAFLRRTRA